MKKIKLCTITLFSFLVASSFAATNVAKNEVATPYYNSGLGFGLAGYSKESYPKSYDSCAKPQQAENLAKPT